MTTYEAMSLVMQFGLYNIALLTLIVAVIVALLIKKSKEEK